MKSRYAIALAMVKTGFTHPDRIEVMGDLHPGDFIVSQANEELKEGVAVEIKPSDK